MERKWVLFKFSIGLCFLNSSTAGWCRDSIDENAINLCKKLSLSNSRAETSLRYLRRGECQVELLDLRVMHHGIITPETSPPLPEHADVLMNAVVAAVKACPVQELFLDGMYLGDQGAQRIADATVSSSSLKALSMTFCNISDDGAISMAKSLNSSQLKEFHVGYNPIG